MTLIIYLCWAGLPLSSCPLNCRTPARKSLDEPQHRARRGAWAASELSISRWSLFWGSNRRSLAERWTTCPAIWEALSARWPAVLASGATLVDEEVLPWQVQERKCLAPRCRPVHRSCVNLELSQVPSNIGFQLWTCDPSTLPSASPQSQSQPVWFHLDSSREYYRT